jgi:hypothetical protein
MFCAIALISAGCFGTRLPTNDDAGYGPGQDLALSCTANNDGVIERSEIGFPIGAQIRYLTNPPGTTVTVAPDGTLGSAGREWDFSSTAGQVLTLDIEPLAGAWYAPSFPDATYATLADVGSDTLGIFKVTDSALLLLGFASRTPNQTLLVYDAPVATLQFPVQLGDGWVTGAHVTNGTLQGQPFASTDTYQVTVDEKGAVILPYLRVENVLRVHVNITQTIPGGVSLPRVQHLFFRECDGEIGRMVSPTGTTDPAFTSAAEFRRLAL